MKADICHTNCKAGKTDKKKIILFSEFFPKFLVEPLEHFLVLAEPFTFWGQGLVAWVFPFQEIAGTSAFCELSSAHSLVRGTGLGTAHVPLHFLIPQYSAEIEFQPPLTWKLWVGYSETITIHLSRTCSFKTSHLARHLN